MLNEITLNNLQRRHLLPYPCRPIPGRAFAPAKSATPTIGTARALQSCGCSGCLQNAHYGVISEGRDFCSSSHPASQVGFVREHVDAAFGEVGFAGNFEGNALGEEDFDCSVEKAGRSLLPDVALRLLLVSFISPKFEISYMVVHGCSSQKKYAGVI